MTKPTSLDIALTFLPIVPGALSILGASAILYNILSDPDRRFTTPYFRIMLCLSAADITYAGAKMFSTFAAPKHTHGLYFSSGNQTTCNAQGFFLILGMIQPLYVASLCINYLMVIKYSKSDEYLSKKLEPWMHLVSLGYPLSGAIACLTLGYINSSPSNCWIGPYPMNCDIHDVRTCIRGENHYMMRWICSGSVIIASVTVISFCMLQVVLFVRKRLLVMKRRFSFANRTISTCTNLENQYKAVTQQALLYVGVFLLVWFFGFLFRVSKKTRNPYLLIPAQVLNPLQGFLNFFVYIWPRYTKTKQENPDRTFWWLIKDAIVTRTKAKIARRRLSDMQIRTAKKRRSIERRSSLRQEAHTHEQSAQSIPIEITNRLSPSAESPEVNLDDASDEEEPITILQQLQRLEATRDSEIDEPMISLQELEMDDLGEKSDEDNVSSILLGSDTKSPKREANRYIGEI